MSQPPISLSADLTKLVDEGYEVQVKGGFLLISHIPHVDENREIVFGTLISPISFAGDITAPNPEHTVFFKGALPFHADGSAISGLLHSTLDQSHGEGITSNFMFSNKPSGGYPDYHAKMTRYISIISPEAASIDPGAKAKTFVRFPADEGESVFKYADSATSRADIGLVTEKLAIPKIGIIGLGGTGSYILDLVAKTPVSEIHLFDGDEFLQHNAFRAPGAPSVDELRKRPSKVSHFHDTYSKMRNGIVKHEYLIDESNIDQLKEMNFVFLAMDTTSLKKTIVLKLQEFEIPFIDVGLGVNKSLDSLTGTIRVTTSTRERKEHVWARNGIPLDISEERNEYDNNIQIADLNALNAALAVIRWKKYYGFYLDLENEDIAYYNISGNHLLNERHPA